MLAYFLCLAENNATAGGAKYHLLVARERLINAMTNASKSGGVRAAITGFLAAHFLRFCHHYDSLLPASVFTWRMSNGNERRKRVCSSRRNELAIRQTLAECRVLK